MMFNFKKFPFSLAIVVLLALKVFSHIEEGQGAALQLFSNFTLNPPKINGVLTDGTNETGVEGTDNDEWRDAYMRTVKMTDGSDATLFLTNTADSLYVGIIYGAGNFGSPNAVMLYFDQGSGGGNHDAVLTGNTASPNENAVGADRSVKTDYYWDGSAWVADTNGETDFSKEEDYFTSIFHWEFAVPLNNGNADDLAVDSDVELGFLFSIFKNGGSGGTFYWDSTNGDPTDASGWADIRLGVQRSFTTFYATHNANGNPTIDGNIHSGTSADDAWRGAFRQNIVLTNYAGSKIDAVIYAIDDDTPQSQMFVGMRVEDTDQNAGDFLRIYQEAHVTTPADNQDYVLDDDKENALEADEAAFNGDLFWDADAAAWTLDTEGADAQNAVGKHYTSHYEYEFAVNYNLGAQDMDLNDKARMGFLVHYFDADQPAGQQDYYWEFTSNSNAVLLNVTETPDVHGAIGWATMQTSAPYVQVIYPEDGSNIEGVSNVRIYAEDENPDGIVSAEFFRAADTTAKFTLTRIAGTDEWAGTWNTQSLVNGEDTLVIRVTDDDGIVLNRLVVVTIANGTGAVSEPAVAVTSPNPGSLISGEVSIAFNASVASPGTIVTREISLDGANFIATTTDNSHVWNTTGLPEGSHTIQVRVYDNQGSEAVTQVISYVVSNIPQVTVLNPTPDSTVRDTLLVSFTATAVEPGAISTTEISLDGGAYVATTTDSTHVLETSSLTDGSHTLRIKAVDEGGSVGYSEMIKFNTSNSPAVEVDPVIVDTVVSGDLAIDFTALPVASASVESAAIRIDGGPWITIEDESSYTLATEGLSDGTHILQIRIKDSNGKIILSHNLAFVSDNSAPKLSLPQVTYAGSNTSALTGSEILVTALALDVTAGMDADSGVVFVSEALGEETVYTVMHDDGEKGDLIKGDNIFSALVEVNSDSTGAIEYSIRGRDAVGNDTTLFSVIELDNTAPEVSYTLDPEPRSDEAGSLSGEVYVSRILLAGTASDIGSGLDVVRITVKNDEGGHVNNSPIDIATDKGKFSRIIDLIQGNNHITLVAVDKAGNLDSLHSKVTYILPKVTELVGSKGGTVSSPNGSSVKIPRNALFSAKEITMRVVDSDEEPKPLNPDIKLLGVPHDFGPDGSIFRKSVTIKLAYTSIDLDPDQDGNPDFTEDDLQIFFWSGESWVMAGAPTVDKDNKTVSVKVNHFTLYDIGVNTSEDGVGVESFKAFWSHNPVKGSMGSVFEVHVPKEGKLSFNIFDMAGDVVRKFYLNERVDPGIYSPMWRGDNVSGTFTGAGLYIYVLKYESDDGKIKKLIRKPVGLLKN